jgi:nicotinate-nucleotide adenylyltransferase
MGDRIGIIGGTFNPIHYGHLFIASEAKESFDLDRVVFVPCHQPPHKSESGLADGEDRYRMVLLAVESNPDFVVSSAELDRGGKSYSIETVDEFQEKYGADSRIYFIIGMDSLGELSTWKDIEKLARRCQFIVAVRPNWEYECSPWDEVCRLMEIPGLEISSTDIRERVKNGRSIKYLLPEVVEEYIYAHKLYK